MDCNNDFCEIEEKKPALCCGTAPVKKINLLSAWIRCPKCGRCATAETFDEATREWNRTSKDSCGG